MSLNQNKHTPVLINEVVSYLRPKPGQSLLDLTAGYGGHAEKILALTKQDESCVLVDRDEQAINALIEKFGPRKVEIRRSDFLQASLQLQEEHKQFDLILADLGMSSPHLDNASRGFAIKADGPLDMRMDNRQQLTANKIVNTYSLEELTSIIKNYGEEVKAHQIALSIINCRPLSTTNDLAQAVRRVYMVRKNKIDPATKTFQAIRIAVNDELNLLMSALPIWLKLLKPGGRLAIISFHSLEDRIVKNFFKQHSQYKYEQEFELLTRKPITASKNEQVFNPRSRSAKLRVVAKIKNKKERGKT